MRECSEYEITIEKLLNVVHSYTDPIRIRVIIGDAWLTCEEARGTRRLHDFYLTKAHTKYDDEEKERLLKYYKDVPVWNITAWHDVDCREIRYGIEAQCHYKDVREGYLAEKADLKRGRVMDKLVEHGIRMLEIVEGENDFFRNDAKRQADIARAVYDTILRVQALERKADRKTENSSEKPNNCEKDCFLCKWLGDVDVCGRCRNRNLFAEADTEPTISKMEQVDKDINVRSKDEPQTCSVNGRPYDCGSCEHFKCTADEPQTERNE